MINIILINRMLPSLVIQFKGTVLTLYVYSSKYGTVHSTHAAGMASVQWCIVAE